MPKGTKVHDCVDKLKRSKGIGGAIAICQSSTNQSYATGKRLKRDRNFFEPKKLAKHKGMVKVTGS